MVNITIIVEGGVIDTNVSAATMDNSNALRESMHRIFTQALGRTDISISVNMDASNRNAARAFVNSGADSFLFADLDTDPKHKDDWFFKMKSGMNPIDVLDAKMPFVFFMIQEMEAWMLKQPRAIEKWAADNGFIHFPDADTVANHRLIADKDIESIAKPSEKLKEIIKQTFQSDKLRKNGKRKGVLYGKLKSAPDILNCLDVATLVANDAELQSFCRKVAEIASSGTAPH